MLCLIIVKLSDTSQKFAQNPVTTLSPQVSLNLIAPPPKKNYHQPSPNSYHKPPLDTFQTLGFSKSA